MDWSLKNLNILSGILLNLRGQPGLGCVMCSTECHSEFLWFRQALISFTEWMKTASSLHGQKLKLLKKKKSSEFPTFLCCSKSNRENTKKKHWHGEKGWNSTYWPELVTAAAEHCLKLSWKPKHVDNMFQHRWTLLCLDVSATRSTFPVGRLGASRSNDSLGLMGARTQHTLLRVSGRFDYVRTGGQRKLNYPLILHIENCPVHPGCQIDVETSAPCTMGHKNRAICLPRCHFSFASCFLS